MNWSSPFWNRGIDNKVCQTAHASIYKYLQDMYVCMYLYKLCAQCHVDIVLITDCYILPDACLKDNKYWKLYCETFVSRSDPTLN